MFATSGRTFAALTVTAAIAWCGAAIAETRVALVLPGSISDGGWNEGAYKGLSRLTADKGFETAYSENVGQADIPRMVRGYADDGYDLIIGHGFQFGSLFAEISADYPDRSFFASTNLPGESEVPPNALYLDHRYFDVAYGAGVLAAMMSEKGEVVGVIGGGDNPVTQGMMKAFAAGAEAARSGIRALSIVTGDYNDAAKGREASTTLIGNGADVIWHTADVTGIGAIEGASAKGVKIIGMYSDQMDLAPEHIGTSFASNNAGIVEAVAHMVRDGSFEGGRAWKPDLDFAWLALSGDGTHNSDIVSDDAWNAFQAAKAEISANRIDTSALVK